MTNENVDRHQYDRSKLEALAQEVATTCGCEIYDLELTSVQGRRTLRVLIDRDSGGVGIEDCSNVSRGLSEKLDLDDPIDGAYDLEVSTPGLDRPLKQPWHFSKVVGKKIQLRLAQSLSNFGTVPASVANAKQIQETLSGIDANGIEILISEQKVNIPFGEIEKAKLVFEMNPKGEKRGSHKAGQKKKK